MISMNAVARAIFELSEAFPPEINHSTRGPACLLAREVSCSQHVWSCSDSIIVLLYSVTKMALSNAEITFVVEPASGDEHRMIRYYCSYGAILPGTALYLTSSMVKPLFN